MTRKLIRFNVCDLCGKENRNPDLSSAVFIAVVPNDDDDTESGTFSGKRMDVCEDCRLKNQLLRTANMMEAGQGSITFKPDTVKAKPKKIVEQTTDEVSCPLCGFGPRGRQSISVHMGRTHRLDKRYPEARQSIWPNTKAAKKKSTRKTKSRPVAKSNLQFLSPEQQLTMAENA